MQVLLTERVVFSVLQLMSQVLGVFQDPTTGLVCIFKEEMLSFMYPALSADYLALVTQLKSGIGYSAFRVSPL